MPDPTIQAARRMRDGKRGPAETTEFFVVKDTSFTYYPGTDRIHLLTQNVLQADGTTVSKVQEFDYDGDGNISGIDQYFV